MESIVEKIINCDMNNLINMEFPLNEQFGLCVESKGISFKFLIHIKDQSDKLLIFSSAALAERDQEKFKNRPLFHRVSWEFPLSTIYYDDPTRNIPNTNLLGGWGLGTMDFWYLDEISKIIKIIANKIYNYPDEEESYKNLIFYGSSMGGFMSIQQSILIKNSISVAEIPQLDLTTFHYWGYLKDNLFKDLTIEEIKEKYSFKLNIIDLIKREKYIPNSYLILDCSHNFDYEHQYKDFLNRLDELPYEENNNINKIKIRIDGKNQGHRPMDYNNLKIFIEKLCLII